MSYIEADELRQYVRVESGSLKGPVLEGARLAAEQRINAYCQRSFTVAGDEATPRVYVPNRSCRLRIHDCTSIDGVTSDGTTVASSTYQAEPLNGIDRTGQAVPYEELVRIDGGYWWPSRWNEATVTVTATWGWPAVPAAVVEACRIIAKDIVQQQDVRSGILAVGDAVGFALPLNKAARDLLNPYRRIEATCPFGT